MKHSENEKMGNRGRNLEGANADQGRGYFNRGDVYENGYESPEIIEAANEAKVRRDEAGGKRRGQYQGMEHGSGLEPKSSEE